MENSTYEDRLIEISQSHVRIKHYYFPFLLSKTIPFEQIARVELNSATLWAGRWRLAGTRDFRTWFPLDLSRPKRDSIFIMTLKQKWFRIGFTVEDSEEVSRIFKQRGLIG